MLQLITAVQDRDFAEESNEELTNDEFDVLKMFDDFNSYEALINLDDITLSKFMNTVNYFYEQQVLIEPFSVISYNNYKDYLFYLSIIIILYLLAKKFKLFK